jgi:hypothetical protein
MHESPHVCMVRVVNKGTQAHHNDKRKKNSPVREILWIGAAGIRIDTPHLEDGRGIRGAHRATTHGTQGAGRTQGARRNVARRIAT